MGRTLIGLLADRVGPVNAMWTVIMLSGLTQLLVWTFVSTYAGIVRIFSQPAARTRLTVAYHDSWRSPSCTASYAAASSRSRPPSPRSSGAPAGLPASRDLCYSSIFPVRPNLSSLQAFGHSRCVVRRKLRGRAPGRRHPQRDGRELDRGLMLFWRPADNWRYSATLWCVPHTVRREGRESDSALDHRVARLKRQPKILAVY